MRYIKDETKASLTYQYYGDPSGYNEWANKLWEVGYTMSVQELSKKLGISASWIVNKWLKEIRHVVYSRKFIYTKTGKEEGTSRVSWEDVEDYLLNVCTFERQTEVIDLYSYLYNADKKAAEKIYKAYKEKMKDDFYNLGIIPPSILSEIERHFITNVDLRNVSAGSSKIGKCRSSVPWKKVEKFNFIDDPNLYIPNDVGQTCYREAFMRGDIKIKLGNKKTWFVKNDIDLNKMKMPFIIPYDSKVNFIKI